MAPLVPGAIPLRALWYCTVGSLAPSEIARVIAEPPEAEWRQWSTVLRACYASHSGKLICMVPSESSAWAAEVCKLGENGAPHLEQVRAMPAWIFVFEEDVRALIA